MNKTSNMSILMFVLASALIGRSHSQTQAPIDLYLAFDQSGSLSEAKFNKLIDFGEALSFGVADITGLYSTEQNGLRVGAVTFGCGSQTKARLSPTGDENLIKDSMDNMRTYVVTFGETCLEPAMQLILGYKDTQADISPPSRATALVVLSDGRFDDFDAWQDELETFRDEFSQGFAVGIGNKVREPEMVAIADGSNDKYFHIENPDALPTLIELIASMVIDDFNTELIDTATGNPISGDICVGRSVSVRFTGNSLSVFSEKSILTCDFVLSAGVTVSVTPTITEVDGLKTLNCENPDIVGISDSFDIALKANGNRALTQTYSLTRNPCFEVSKFFEGVVVEDFTTCWGAANALVDFTGESAEYIMNSVELSTVGCTLSFLSGVLEESELQGVLTYDANSVVCALPDSLFSVSRAEPDNITLTVYYETEELGKTEIISERLDTSEAESCLQFSLLNGNNEDSLCVGDDITVTVHGTSIATFLSKQNSGEITVDGCYLADNVDALEMTISSDDSSLSCKLPFTSGLVNESSAIYVSFEYSSTGVKDQLLIDFNGYELTQCFDEGFPKKVVVQSTDAERIEDGRFCAGDGYDIEFYGPTIDSLIRLVSSQSVVLTCEFYRDDSLTEVLFTETAVQRSDNTVICSALRWDPYDPVSSSYYDLSLVKLVSSIDSEIVTEPFAKDIYTGNSFCFDNPDHGVPDGFEPPANALKARSLQDESCYPYCCKRSSVQIAFSGRTINVISNAQTQSGGSVLQCVYTTTENTELVTGVDLTGPSAGCQPAPGWTLRDTTGDYISVVLELVGADGRITPFSRFDYTPSSGSLSCVNNVPLDYYCLGEAVTFESYGLTLLALDADPSLVYDENLFTSLLDNRNLDITVLDNTEKTVISTWMDFDEEELLISPTFELFADGESISSNVVSEVRIENLERCIDISIAASSCFLTESVEMFTTTFVGAGEAVIFYPPTLGDYNCKFYNQAEGSESVEAVPASINANTNAISCEVDDSVGFNSFQVSYTNATDNRVIVIKEGAIAIQQTACVDPLGGGDRGFDDPTSPLAYILPICLLFVLVVLVLLFVYKNRKKQETQKNLPPIAPIVLNVGDKAEVFILATELSEATNNRILASNIPKQDEGFWFKATVIEKKIKDNESESVTSDESSSTSDIETGSKEKFLYNVELDTAIKEFSVTKECLTNLDQRRLRLRPSDFQVDDKTLSHEDNKIAVIQKILLNDLYLAVKDGETVVVAGATLTILQDLVFNKGDLVFVKETEESEMKVRGEVIDSSFIDQTYTVNTLDSNLKQVVPLNRVFKMKFNVDDVVQVCSGETEDTKSEWKRGVIAKALADNKYDVRQPNLLPELLKAVELRRLRYPIFLAGEKVEVISDPVALASPSAKDWHPGFVQTVHQDQSTYDVRLTKENITISVSKEAIRKQRLDEIIKRVRQGIPERSKNLDSNTPDSGKDIVPLDKRFLRRRPVDYTELPNHQFDITVDSSEGLGVKFGWTEDNIIVAGFRDMANGDWGVLEATGLVMVKDQLIQINGEVVANYGISDITDLIKESKSSSTITLRFGRDNVKK